MQVGSAWGFLLPEYENREKWKRGKVCLFREIGSRDDIKDNAEDGEQQRKEAQRLGNGAHYVEAEQAQRCKCDYCKNDLFNKISDFVTHFKFLLYNNFVVCVLVVFCLFVFYLLILYYSDTSRIASE